MLHPRQWVRTTIVRQGSMTATLCMQTWKSSLDAFEYKSRACPRWVEASAARHRQIQQPRIEFDKDLTVGHESVVVVARSQYKHQHLTPAPFKP